MRAMRGPRNFFQGGPGQTDKKALTVFFILFFSPQLILQKSNDQFKRNLSFYHFSKFQRGSNIFQGGGGPTFSRGGVQLLISYRNPYNL